MISKRQMGLAMPTALKSGRLDIWYDALVAAMTRCQITTDKRIDDFMANVAEETGELQAREENLHYSAGQLRALFPTIFDGQANADQVAAGGPVLVGNTIYGDRYRTPNYRMGNRDEGDGYKYRGRGPMQLTGRGNYEAFFRSVNMPIDSDPDLLLQPEMGALSAAMFWQRAGCNELSDRDDFTDEVIRINGGTINLATRQMYRGRFIAASANPDPVVAAPAPAPAAEPPKPKSVEPVAIPAPPVPDAPPPVTAEELKPKPQLEPVPPPPPVPPPGFSVQPSGNVVRDDVRQSSIVKGANVGQVVTGTAATVTAATGAAASVKGLLPEHISDVGIVCLTVILLALLGMAFWYFRKVKNDRIAMNKQGIA